LIVFKIFKIKFMKKALYLFVITTLFSCSSSNNEIEATLPVLNTLVISNITMNSAMSGGNITFDGGTNVIEKGIVWSTSQNPTIESNSKTSNGTGVGDYTSNLTGLNSGTTYYVRAYATNSVGTAYGNQLNLSTLTLTDDTSVLIGTQTWSKKNLDTSTYSDGTPIPQVTDSNTWNNLTTGAWCYYENNSTNGTIYGKLYNSYAVEGIYDNASLTNVSLRKKLAPVGWHIPTNSEWEILYTFLGGQAIAGGKMKATQGWIAPNVGANNFSGFTGLPGGFRRNYGTFENIGNKGLWWSSSRTAQGIYNYVIIENVYTSLDFITSTNSNKQIGFSVRCVKN
jgi:uncharacterized protein (TIGR02145 family)